MKVFQILLHKHEHFVVLSFLELNTKFIDTLQGRLLQNDKNLYTIPCTYTHTVAGEKMQLDAILCSTPCPVLFTECCFFTELLGIFLVWGPMNII